MKRFAFVWVLLLGCDQSSGADSSTTPPGATPVADAAPAPEAAPQTVTFGSVEPAVGMVRTNEKVFTTTMTMNIEVEGQKLTAPFSSEKVENKREEVLAQDGGTPTKLRVTYDKVQDTKTEAAGKTVEDSPTSGKTYVVELVDGAVKAKREGKRKTPKAEREAVQKDYKRMATPDPLSAQIRGQTLEIGKTLELDAADFGSVGDEGSEGSFVLELVETTVVDGQEMARFKVEMTMKGPTEHGEVSVQTSGTALVDVATGSPSTLDLTGPMQMSATGKAKDGRPMTISADGTASFKIRETGWHAAEAA